MLQTCHHSMQAVQNLGLTVFIIVAGRVVGKLGYLYLEIIFLNVLSLAFIAGMHAVLLCIVLPSQRVSV